MYGLITYMYGVSLYMYGYESKEEWEERGKKI